MYVAVGSLGQVLPPADGGGLLQLLCLLCLQPLQIHGVQGLQLPFTTEKNPLRQNSKYDVKILTRTAIRLPVFIQTTETRLRQIGMNLKVDLRKPNFQGIKCQP